MGSARRPHALRSSSALRRRSESFPALVIAELQQIEVSLGGRGQIIGLLTLAPLTADLRYLLGVLGDPQNQSVPLADLCAASNILPGTLLDHLATAALLRGKVAAQQKIGEGIAAVAEDVMKRAAPYEDACHTCQGIGTLTPEPTPTIPNPSPLPCEICRGTGRLLYRPDLERQKLAIEMAQLLPKSAGIQIAMQQNNGTGGGGSGGGVLDRLQEISDRVLYGQESDQGGAVEAEVLPSEGDAVGDADA